MRLRCSVEVFSQLAPSLNIRGKRRSTHSVLTLQVKKSTTDQGKDKHVILVLSTAQNASGIKYKIFGNVKQVFTKFANEGKTTIRFVEPPHDLIIKSADPLQLKSFLHALSLATKNKDLEKIHYSVPPSKIQKPKTKLIVSRKEDYPFYSGFPFTLTVLQLNNCGLQKLSPSILHLLFLEKLDLNHNEFESISFDCAKFQDLKELSLSHNKLQCFPLSICSSSFRNGLVSLNLDSNKMSLLPFELGELRFLKALYVRGNCLTHLPRNIGQMKYLKVIVAAHNSIKALPCSMLQMSLESLDLHDNPLNQKISHGLSGSFGNAPSLKECAAQVIVAWKVPYSAEDLPPHLMDYLKTCHWCICGRPHFAEGTKPSIGSVDLLRVAETVTSVDSSGRRTVPIEVFICKYCVLPSTLQFLRR